MVIFFLKNYCGAPGGPISTIFATITLDPLYFEVHIFSDPLDPPYMSKNAKMCYFEHFFGVRWKKPPLCRGPPWKILHWKFVPAFFYGLLYMLGLCLFIFATFSNEKVITFQHQGGTYEYLSVCTISDLQKRCSILKYTSLLLHTPESPLYWKRNASWWQCWLMLLFWDC